MTTLVLVEEGMEVEDQVEVGQVESVDIVRDRDTRCSKGFAFVEMPVSIHAKAAISALNGRIFHQPTRTLTVNEAQPREDRNAETGSHRRSARVDKPKLSKRGGVYHR